MKGEEIKSKDGSSVTEDDSQLCLLSRLSERQMHILKRIMGDSL